MSSLTNYIVNEPKNVNLINLFSSFSVIVQIIGIIFFILGLLNFSDTIQKEKSENIQNSVTHVNFISFGIFIFCESLLLIEYLRQCKLENSESAVFALAKQTNTNFQVQLSATETQLQNILQNINSIISTMNSDTNNLNLLNKSIDNFNKNFKSNQYYISQNDPNYINLQKIYSFLNTTSFTIESLDNKNLVDILQSQQNCIKTNYNLINNSNYDKYIRILQFYYELKCLKNLLCNYFLNFQIPNITDGIITNYYCGDLNIQTSNVNNNFITTISLQGTAIFTEKNGEICSYGIINGLPLNSGTTINKQLFLSSNTFALSYGNKTDINTVGKNFTNGLATNNVSNILIISYNSQLFILEFQSYCLMKINVINWNNGIFLHRIYEMNGINNLITGDLPTYTFNNLSINILTGILTINDFSTYNFLYKQDNGVVFLESTNNITTGYYFNGTQFFTKNLSSASLSSFMDSRVIEIANIIQS